MSAPDVHEVKFHVGTSVVVCTCGAYFESERLGLTMPRSAVSLWADHLRRTLSPTSPAPVPSPTADEHDDRPGERPPSPLGRSSSPQT